MPSFFALVGAAGFFFGLPNTVLHLPFLALLFPFCLYRLAALAASVRQALWYGWLAGVMANAAGLYWMIFPMHDVAGIPLFLAVPCVLLLCAFLACYWGLAALALRNLRLFFAARGTRTHWFLLAPLCGGLVFGGFEVLEGTLFSGFPWLALATAFAFTPTFAQAACLTGAYFLGALYAAAACLLAAASLATNARKRAAALVTAALVFTLPALYGQTRLTDAENSSVPVLPLVMVQGNVDQSHKWDPAFQKATLELYIALSREALAKERAVRPEKPPLLLIWPETAMPFYYPLHREHAWELQRFAEKANVHLAFGALGIERTHHTPDRLLNRFNLLSPTGTTISWYDKRHLVPFGEYTPFAVNIPLLRELLQGIDFSAGTNVLPMLMPVHGPEWGGTTQLSLGALICYEVIFPSLAQTSVGNGASILITVSNDGWFRKSSAPVQHLAHAVLRAIEQARPMARATNTGITAVIDARGRITDRIEGLFVEGTLAADLRPSDETTLYHRLHPAPETVLALAALAALGLASLPRIRRSEPPA